MHLQSLHTISIIDYGLCQRYLTDDGQHKPREKNNVFVGNLVFASKNAFKGSSLSRRDDLMSLCYVMLYLLDGDLVFMANEGESSEEFDNQKELQIIGSKKVKMTPEELCVSEESAKLIPFLKEVYALGYYDEPDYNKLRFLLVKELINMDITPDKEYDWIPE
jgi:hypothetical protein